MAETCSQKWNAKVQRLLVSVQIAIANEEPVRTAQ